MYVGIDWTSRAHELCVVDGEGAVVARFGFAHSERGITEALERLSTLGHPADLLVAIERPDGLLVDRPLEAGHPVVPIHANAFHATRPRWEGAGSKSDPGDAYRLADLLRTDSHRLRAFEPLDPATRELRALVRLRDNHVAARVAATNQLAALLAQHEQANLLRPPPRVGTISLGQIVAEVGPLLERSASSDEAAALCGAVPVTKRSGQHHAVRILARARLRVIWARWHTDTPYDPARRRGHDRHREGVSFT